MGVTAEAAPFTVIANRTAAITPIPGPSPIKGEGG